MPAANISEVRAHAAAAQAAATALLEAAGVPAFHERGGADLPDVYAWPLFTRGRASGHVARGLPVVGFEYDLFPDSTLTIEIFCPRLNNEPKTLLAVYDFLEELAVKADDAFSGFAGRDAFNARLAWHHMDALIPGAEQRGFDEDRNIDRHTLTYTGIWGVKSTAWPTTAAGYKLG
jgi:hypothetical protein